MRTLTALSVALLLCVAACGPEPARDEAPPICIDIDELDARTVALAGRMDAIEAGIDALKTGRCP